MTASNAAQAPVRRGSRARIRRVAICLATALWGVLAIDMLTPGVIARSGHIKGEDYLHFYVLGRLARERNVAALYDMSAQATYAETVVTGAPRTYFVPVYGPQVAVLFEPLSLLPYQRSVAAWSAITVFLYIVCCLAFLRACPRLRAERRDVVLLLIASPALWQLVLHGQNSIVALAAFTAGWSLLRSGHPFGAGLALGVLFYKPQLGLAIGAALLLTGRWRVIVGVAVAAGAQLALAALILGGSVLGAYLRMMMRLPDISALLEPKPYLLHSFHAFFEMISPTAHYAIVLSAVCSLGILVLVVRHWRSMRDPDLTFALLLIATVLVSPHTSVYDLVILTPALLLAADRSMSRNDEGESGGEGLDRVGHALIAAIYVVPLLPFVAQYLYLQPSVVILTWLLVRTVRSRPLLRLHRPAQGPATPSVATS